MTRQKERIKAKEKKIDEAKKLQEIAKEIEIINMKKNQVSYGLRQDEHDKAEFMSRVEKDINARADKLLFASEEKRIREEKRVQDMF